MRKIAFLLLLSSFSSETLEHEFVSDCDKYCSNNDVNKCCSDHGYMGKIGSHGCTNVGNNVWRALCNGPWSDPRTLSQEKSKDEVIKELKNEVSRLKTDMIEFQGKLNVCETDHKKYVESMARTKAIIEGILARKSN